MMSTRMSFFRGWLGIEYIQTIQLPDVVVPEVPALPAIYEQVADDMGNLVQGKLITPATQGIPERIVSGGTQEILLQCTSYDPTQMELIRADCENHGVKIEGADAEAIAKWMSEYVPPAPPAIDRIVLSAQIDADVDALYARVIGNRAAEYEQAEREALAYADKSFIDPVPPMVQAWASAKSWTGERAAKDIIAQAGAWRGAQTQIRTQRLLRKEQIRTAVSDDVVHAAVAAWGEAFGQIKKMLGMV